MTREYVLWNLREAAEELSRTIQEMDKDPDYDSCELVVAMSHLYHHLNTAWNARLATAEEVEACSADNFRRWRQFPLDDFDMTVGAD